MSTGADVGLRIAGTAVALVLAFLTALWEIFASPLRAGGFPLPVSPLAAVLTNLGLVWFTLRVTGRSGLALLPGVVWFATMVVAANRTAAGDLLMPGNDYMGLVAILLGCGAWGLAGYRMVAAGRPSGLGTPVRPAAPPVPAGRPGTKPATVAKPAPGAKPATGAKPAPGAKASPAGRGQGRRRPSGR